MKFEFEFKERRLLIPRASFLAHGVVRDFPIVPRRASPKIVILQL